MYDSLNFIHNFTESAGVITATVPHFTVGYGGMQVLTWPGFAKYIQVHPSTPVFKYIIEFKH